MAHLLIGTTSRHAVPRLPFQNAADVVLGKNYDISLAFIGSTRSRTLNHTLRGKNKPANVLSFPLSPTSGETYIDLLRAKKEASKFNMSFRQFVFFLFIHGLLHLGGYEHGRTMESKERALLSRLLP